MNTRNTIAALLLISALPGIPRAGIPRTIAFQGVLADASGKAKPDGSYNITFRLYDALSDGNLLWTEANKPVTVAGGRGVFTTSLGTPTTFGALTFDAPYFVDIQVQGEAAAMTPRLPLQAVPYALSAGAANLTLPFAGSANVPAPGDAVAVTNTGSGSAIRGTSGGPTPAIFGDHTGTASAAGVEGHSGGFNGVVGCSTAAGAAGVAGVSNGAGAGNGLYGRSENGGSGVYGTSAAGAGVTGLSTSSSGVWGQSTTGSGLTGITESWIGVYGQSGSNAGVWGRGLTSTGVYGTSDGAGIGVYGESVAFEGVRGTSHNAGHGGVVGINTTNGIAVYGISTGGGYGGFFEGRVRVGVLEIAGGSDLAEKFNVTEQAAPGTVMAIDVDHAGQLCIARAAYSTTVAGVVSGANRLSAGIVLPDTSTAKDAVPLAMSGRVWVKCDASTGAIKPGDLLTTSDTPGHAMKVTDHARAQGATLGKAMTALAGGRGLVLALVSLQ